MFPRTETCFYLASFTLKVVDLDVLSLEDTTILVVNLATLLMNFATT